MRPGGEDYALGFNSFYAVIARQPTVYAVAPVRWSPELSSPTGWPAYLDEVTMLSS